MRRLLAAALAVLCAAPAGAVANQFGGFAQYSNSSSIKPFTRDLGGLLGSATFNSGRSLGFSGFDVGPAVAAQFYPSKGDTILLNNGVKGFGMPWVHADIGLPFKIDGFIRGISYDGLTVAGGGLRYGLYAPSDKPWTPQVLVSVVGDSVVHQDFSASHFGGDVVASMGNARVTPYIGAGFDRTGLEAHVSNDLALEGTSATTLESRFTAGVRVKPFQFTYIDAAFDYLHGQAAAEAGLGVRF
ncbi:MAG: hypothetical protein HKL90_16015 [Elusimicrobia bacterium]|nr:hypothetical protein [Elusimicrobiota bacterium]